jgi:hypothetical protein
MKATKKKEEKTVFSLCLSLKLTAPSTQDQCCPKGHQCCEASGRGSACAPPNGKCCVDPKDATKGHSCGDGFVCCGNKCMPTGAVCCETVVGSPDSHYCPEGSKCLTDSPKCSAASGLLSVSALAALASLLSMRLL